MATVTVKFDRERDTKNKVRYQENGEGDPRIGTLYVSKSTVNELGNPENLTVTIKGE